jgi:phage regulator Rha-like protein
MYEVTRDGSVTVASHQAVEHFGKQHKDLLRVIRNLERSDECSWRNFAQTPYTDPQNGQTYQMYELSGDGTLTVTSRQVAEHLGKQHYNVMRDIRELDCSPEFTALNFEASEYVDVTGRKLPQMLMTRDGFTF